MATAYGTRLNFRDASAASCKGLPMAVAGRVQKSRAQSMTWKARESLVRWPEVALAMGMAKRTLLDVKAPPARTFSSR